MDPYHHIRHHYPPNHRPELHQKCNRGSHSSDTSSAYSGSDTMTSVYGSSLEAEEIDLSGLVESVVDSDEEDLAESMDSLNVRDAVRDCLEKDPSERTEEDVEILLEFTQGLKAFTNITLPVRRALCSVMVFAVVDKAGTVVMSDGEELDSWSVLINGAVEIEHANGAREELQMGDSFGILPTMDKLYHRGVMRTKCDDCQFVCITQTDYYRIQHQGEENTRRHEDEDGQVVMVTELRQIGSNEHAGTNTPATGAAGAKRGHVVIRGTPERLLLQLVEENSMTDPTYVEDFLLTHRIFIKNPQEVTRKLLLWFEHEGEPPPKGSTATPQEIRDRVTRVVLLWVNNHFTDFEADSNMMEFLETFEAGLERRKLLSQLRLLHIACAAKARLRCCTLTRSSRDESLNFNIIGGYEMRGATASSTGCGIYISHVELGSKAQDAGLKRGDQIHEVNGQSFEHVTSKRAMEILTGTTHLSITVKSNLLGFKEMMQAVEQESLGGCDNGSNGGSICAANAAKSLRSPRRICANDIAKLHGHHHNHNDDLTSNRAHIVRLSSVDMLLHSQMLNTDQPDCCVMPPPQTTPTNSSISTTPQSGNLATNFMNNILQSVKKDAANMQQVNCDANSKGGGFMTLAPKRRLQKALAKMNLLNKNVSGGMQQTSLNDSSDTLLLNPPNSADGIAKHKIASNSSSTSSSSTTTGGGVGGRLYQSQSNPDLTSSLCYDDTNSVSANYLTASIHRPSATSTIGSNMLPDYPEHVLKVYKADQTCKYLLINKETTAHEVVMLALQEFGIHDPSSNFSLCEVSVGEGGMVKQRRLPDQLQNLAERISFAARYYLKTNGITETLVPDELALELVRDSTVHFLQLNAYELAIQLTLQDFAIFRQIESTEYIDDLFQLPSRYGVSMLLKFAELVNREMFWVVSEICSEHNIVRRMKIVKQFIKIARHCKECRNFNSMFAIISGLGHAAVSRLRQTWDKLPTKYQRLFSDLQDLMDPSRNMSKYRQLVSAELLAQHPIIPFYPIVKKDLTFIHLGNDTRVDDLINFEKLRMIAKEVRLLTHMCSSPYDLLAILELKGQSPSNAMFSLNQMSTSQHNAGTNTVIASNAGQATIKRRKKSTAAPNPKKMFEEAQMVRRVKSYLNNLKIISDEDILHKYSLECEPANNSQLSNSQNQCGNSSRSGDQLSIYSHTSSSSAPNSSLSLRKRHPSSPTLSTTSSTSSTSDNNRRNLNSNCPKFGTASPQAVKKILSLSESTKIRPHQPFARHATHTGHAGHTGINVLPLLNNPHHMHTHGFTLPSGVAALATTATPSPSPCSHRRLASGSNSIPGNSLPTRAIHERSHSDTPTPPLPVDLSVESSSVTTFRDLPLRKSVTSGSVSSSDSGHGSYAQHDINSVYTAADCRLLQQISNTATRNLSNQCNTNIPTAATAISTAPTPPQQQVQQQLHTAQQQQPSPPLPPPLQAQLQALPQVHLQAQSQQIPPPPQPPPYIMRTNPNTNPNLYPNSQVVQSPPAPLPNLNIHANSYVNVQCGASNATQMLHHHHNNHNLRHSNMHGGPSNFLDGSKCPMCPMPPMNQ